MMITIVGKRKFYHLTIIFRLYMGLIKYNFHMLSKRLGFTFGVVSYFDLLMSL